MSDASSAYSDGDYKKALKIWQQLADEGHLQSQFNIAYMHEFGIEVKPDYKEAVKWYTKAANKGYARAQNFLGWMYETGKGVKRDRATALKWLKLAADQGNEDAIADHRLVEKRYQRFQDREYKQALYEVLKEELLRSEDRYYKSKLPIYLDAANDIS
jgi:TPR repeat protein